MPDPRARAALANRVPDLEGRHPARILRWAWERFGPEVGVTSSFQTQSVPLLHMVATAVPEMPVLFLDTGFHFPETLAFRDRLVRELGLEVRVLASKMGNDAFRRRYGTLYRSDPDLCCYINKVEPLARAKKGLAAWVSGIRRDQTRSRRATPVLSWDEDGLWKVCPLAGWTAEDVARYRAEHDLPSHPLHDEGYRSIGCAPCTRRTREGEDPRAGRWAGLDKTECGLHGDGPLSPG